MDFWVVLSILWYVYKVICHVHVLLLFPVTFALLFDFHIAYRTNNVKRMRNAVRDHVVQSFAKVI